MNIISHLLQVVVQLLTIIKMPDLPYINDNTQSQNVRAVYQKIESMLKEAANKNYRLCAHIYWESISLIKLSKPPG